MKIELLPEENEIDTWTILYAPGYLEINKADITDVQAEKSFLAKKAIVTLNDGSKHVFNYGMLNIDKVVEAIKAN